MFRVLQSYGRTAVDLSCRAQSDVSSHGEREEKCQLADYGYLLVLGPRRPRTVRNKSIELLSL